MKKLLVMTAALALFATPVLALIDNGPHDFGAVGQGTTEICVFCHTPHAATSTTSDPIPLSNRTGTGSTFCMGCHDGTVLYNDVSNKVNGDTPAGAAYSIPGANKGNFGAVYASNNHPIGATAIWTAGGVMKATSTLITAGQTVECYSCHQVHAQTSPLLKVSNADSALCVACHNK